MTPWPHIPDDAVDWFRAVFAEANRRVTERLLNVPNIRETALDDGLIEAIIPYSPPRLLPSGAVVEMNVHNIGGLRRLGPWETADIAVLVFVYRNGALVPRRSACCNPKRLYPSNNDVDDEDPVGFAYGMNRFLRRDPNSPLGRLHREFEFTVDCRYGALKAGSDQVAVIDRLNEEFGDAVYYLLYNPPLIPTRVRYPVAAYQTITQPPLGCRVYAPTDVDAALAALDEGQAPTLAELEAAGSSSNWRLETWAADLLRCKVGQQFGEDRQEIRRGSPRDRRPSSRKAIWPHRRRDRGFDRLARGLNPLAQGRCQRSCRHFRASAAGWLLTHSLGRAHSQPTSALRPSQTI